MMTRRVLLALLQCSLLSTVCSASSIQEGVITYPGLSHNDINNLNGVWEEYNMLSSQAKADRWKSVWEFSWGKGRVSPASLLIDLTSKEPEIQLVTVYWVDVLGVSMPEPQHYRFATRNKYSRNPDLRGEPVIDSVDITLHADGTITCISSLEANSPARDEGQYHFFRTYGPGVSQ